MKIRDVQAHMRQESIDGWLLYDFRGNNPVLAELLPGQRWTTRRVLMFIPAEGEPVVLAHTIDLPQFLRLGVKTESYVTWQEFGEWIGAIVRRGRRLAMEYVQGGALPVVSLIDAGTVELVRSLGADVVSSADLIQISAAVWSDDAVRVHKQVSATVNDIKDKAFALIGSRLRAEQGVTEVDVQKFILSEFQAKGLETPDSPVVAVNAHAGDPHYEVTDHPATPIEAGDFVLIDLWARSPGNQNIFSDITWVGFAGKTPGEKHREIFGIVREARDAAVSLSRKAWKSGQVLQGWQLDDAARLVLEQSGNRKFIRHRTGHSLSPGTKVHGLGANLDNLETHDTRRLLPRLGFTVEPGLYLPEFGVRLEINMYMDPNEGPIVTSGIQDEIILIEC